MLIKKSKKINIMIGYNQLIKNYLKNIRKLKFTKKLIFLKMATHLHGTNLNNFGKIQKKYNFISRRVYFLVKIFKQSN